MRKLFAFANTSLEGYFAGANGDLSWADSDDAEFNDFVAENAKAGGVLLFGRTTYQMMANYWPTPLAMEHDPVVAERMNALPKVVFSTTLTEPSWHNTTLMKGDIAAIVRAMKSESGPDMAILGSGSIVSQLAQAGLIDEFQIVVNPVVLGDGKMMFEGVKEKLQLALINTRTFRNGKVLLRYEPSGGH